VKDNLTGLIWLRNASCFGNRNWISALSDANRLASGSCGLTDGSVAGDWRLPNVRELLSLIEYGQNDQTLPAGHPFSGVQLSYHSSTTSSGAGNSDNLLMVRTNGSVNPSATKAGRRHVWPVRGGRSIADSTRSPVALSTLQRFERTSGVEAASTLPDRQCQGVPATGQTDCWDQVGVPIDCAGTGQDGEHQYGWTVHPYPRFTDNGNGTVKDNLTGLIWLRNGNCFGERNWIGALSDANSLASGSCGLTDGSVAGDWRLPNIKELLSLVDYGEYDEALPEGHPFFPVQLRYWSSATTPGNNQTFFSAWMLFLVDGRVEFHHKVINLSYVWPVRGGGQRNASEELR
jgi:hypothetical protein